MEEKQCRLSNPRKTSNSCQVLGADLLKYYHRPVESIFHHGDLIPKPEEEYDLYVWEPCEKYQDNQAQKFLNKSTQTDYRESEAQTDPWDPPYKVVKVYKEPEILSLKRFTYGHGLPPTMLEVGYITETRENEYSEDKWNAVEDMEEFKKNTKIVCDQAKTFWDYKVAVKTETQLQKLELMKSSLINELQKNSNKREQILKNMWNKKKEEMYKQNVKLEEKLNKELRATDNKYLTTKHSSPPSSMAELEKTSVNFIRISPDKKVDSLLNNFLVSNPEGLSTVKTWLEKKQTVLKNKVSLPKFTRKTEREKLAEEAYKDILSKMRTKLPPKVYHEDYEREEIPLPEVKPEDVTDYLVLNEEKIDLVTVWQKMLRGLAHQKQMLELVEKHKPGLAISLSNVISEKK